MGTLCNKPNNSAGFTIIELMIATTVFSVVLVILVFAVLHITESYYKGITQSNTLDVSRQTINNITQAIQFSSSTGVGSTPPPAHCTGPATTNNTSAVCGVCLGDQYFQYTLGVEQEASRLVLGTRDQVNCATSGPIPVGSVSWSNLTAILKNNMRLTQLSIAPVGSQSLYHVTVGVVYGDDDLLCNPSAVVGSCNPYAHTMTVGSEFVGAVLCKGVSGSQFCLTSVLGTDVQQRFTSN